MMPLFRHRCLSTGWGVEGICHGEFPPPRYSNVRAVRILLECILDHVYLRSAEVLVQNVIGTERCRVVENITSAMRESVIVFKTIVFLFIRTATAAYIFNRQAILMYNMCILHAPLIADPEQVVEGTGELALGFANRSAAFYHLNKREECLKVRTGSTDPKPSIPSMEMLVKFLIHFSLRPLRILVVVVNAKRSCNIFSVA